MIEFLCTVMVYAAGAIITAVVLGWVTEDDDFVPLAFFWPIVAPVAVLFGLIWLLAIGPFKLGAWLRNK